MSTVSIENVVGARERIKPIIPMTPVKRSIYLRNQSGIECYLKLENLNISGSFKIRGAANALLQTARSDLDKGVICASAGNHAQAVAYICKTLNAKTSIFMPERTPIVKVESTKNLGGHVILKGAVYDDAYQEAVKFQKSNGGIFIHAFANEEVVCGQGSVGLEILEQIPSLGMVLVPIGGGGLISGIACAIKERNPSIIVIGVETTCYPAMSKSLEKGEICTPETQPSIADGIAVKHVAPLTFGLVQKYVDDILLIDENSIASSIMTLIERDHIVAEGAGAISAAALSQLPEKWIKKLGNRAACCIISGGNIDVNLLNRIAVKGQVHAGRTMRIKSKIKDRPGSLSQFLAILGENGGNILEVEHNRVFGDTSFDAVDIQLDVETSSHKHQLQIKKALEAAGFDINTVTT